jgi:hypothetical protein
MNRVQFTLPLTRMRCEIALREKTRFHEIISKTKELRVAFSEVEKNVERNRVLLGRILYGSRLHHLPNSFAYIASFLANVTHAHRTAQQSCNPRIRVICIQRFSACASHFRDFHEERLYRKGSEAISWLWFHVMCFLIENIGGVKFVYTGMKPEPGETALVISNHRHAHSLTHSLEHTCASASCAVAYVALERDLTGSICGYSFRCKDDCRTSKSSSRTVSRSCSPLVMI